MDVKALFLEKLKGGQKKLDMDKDGDIDAADFAAMRAKKKKNESLEESTEVLSESLDNHAEHHMRTIDHIAVKHSEDEGHHVDKHQDDLDKLHHAHTSLAKLHDAHATIHRANGNHDAADAHEDAATNHHDWAKASTRSYARRTHRNSLDSHEEYDHGSGMANDESREAFKNHPIK